MTPSLRAKSITRYLEFGTAVALAVAIVPSLTALAPKLGSWIGPLNLLKVLSPIPLIYLCWAVCYRNGTIQSSSQFARAIALTGLAFAISTLGAGYLCHFPPNFMRETFVMALSAPLAASFFVMNATSRYRVAVFWGVFTVSTALLDATFPEATDWLLKHFFDPNSRRIDLIEVGQVVSGVLGRQSLAKLLAWTPWLILATAPKVLLRHWVLLVISFGLILPTSQRGPFVAATTSGICWIWLLWRRNPEAAKRGLPTIALAISAIIGFTLAVAPPGIVESRLTSLLGLPATSQLGQSAQNNITFRKQMYLFSAKTALQHPFGHACISGDEFMLAGITHLSHSHNVFLEQFRSRGWLWGLVHLFLWFSILFLNRPKARQTQNAKAIEAADYWFCAWISLTVSGLFDHVWPVLNQAVIVSCVLIGSSLQVAARGQNPKTPESAY